MHFSGKQSITITNQYIHFDYILSAYLIQVHFFNSNQMLLVHIKRNY